MAGALLARAFVRTCVSGRTCSVDGFAGPGLTPDDALMLADTCGADAAPPLVANAGRSLRAVASGTSFSWGEVPTTAPGGAYRLCWCSGLLGACGAPSDFKVDVGTLVVQGLDDCGGTRAFRTCVSGDRGMLSAGRSVDRPSKSTPDRHGKEPVLADTI